MYLYFLRSFFWPWDQCDRGQGSSLSQAGIDSVGSMKKDPTEDQSHKTALLCSAGKFTKLNQQERREVSWVEENVPTPVPLNEINIRVDTDHI